jgi:hypothetical protein
MEKAGQEAKPDMQPINKPESCRTDATVRRYTVCLAGTRGSSALPTETSPAVSDNHPALAQPGRTFGHASGFRAVNRAACLAAARAGCSGTTSVCLPTIRDALLISSISTTVLPATFWIEQAA